MGDRKLETVAKEVFLSIPPDVRTGVFIDVFTPCDWHHAARCMVDYAGILDDPREPFAPACDMPVIFFWFAETSSFRAGRKQTVLLSQIDMI